MSTALSANVYMQGLVFLYDKGTCEFVCCNWQIDKRI